MCCMLPNLDEIQRRRKMLGITQKDLAVSAGVSQSLIAKIESEKIDPSYSSVTKIFNALDRWESNKKRKVLAKDIHNKKIIGVKETDSVLKAVKLMHKYAYSQLPVFDEHRKAVGSISESTINSYMASGKNIHFLPNMLVQEIMNEAFPQINEDTPIEIVNELLKYEQAVLTGKKGKLMGIITKADLFKFVRE